jgi:hypothetical protein
MLAQKNQRLLELEAQWREVVQSQSKVVEELRSNRDHEEKTLLEEQLELLCKLEVPILTLISRYKERERKENERRNSQRRRVRRR